MPNQLFEVVVERSKDLTLARVHDRRENIEFVRGGTPRACDVPYMASIVHGTDEDIFEFLEQRESDMPTIESNIIDIASARRGFVPY